MSGNALPLPLRLLTWVLVAVLAAFGAWRALQAGNPFVGLLLGIVVGVCAAAALRAGRDGGE